MPLDRGMILPHHRYSARTWSWPAYRQYLLRTDWPILCGPWHGEVGFEAMYWIPFLDRLKADGIDPARLIPITSGGAAQWYGTELGLELYHFKTPQEVRIENRLNQIRTGLHKQLTCSVFDRDVLKKAAAKLGVQRYHTLHPSWMYHTIAPFWTGLRGSSWLVNKLAFQQIPTPPLPADLQLPPQFVATRFYARDTFPFREPLVQQFVHACTETIAAGIPVVAIDPPGYTDDHVEFPVPNMPGQVFKLHEMTTLTPENTLAVQTAVMGRAQAVVGTYGGILQLASRMGRPAVGFYLKWGGTSLYHRHLSEHLALLQELPFQVHKLTELPMLGSILPKFEVQSTPTSSPAVPADVLQPA